MKIRHKDGYLKTKVSQRRSGILARISWYCLVPLGEFRYGTSDYDLFLPHRFQFSTPCNEIRNLLAVSLDEIQTREYSKYKSSSTLTTLRIHLKLMSNMNNETESASSVAELVRNKVHRSTVTDCGLDECGSIPGRERNFASAACKSALGSSSLLLSACRRLFL